MAWSGGTYTKGNNGTGGWAGDASLGIGIEASRHDTQDNDFAAGINNCLAKDGQNSMTNNLNFGGFRPSNIAAGNAAAPAICAGNDVNTGMYSPGADQIGFATAGIERITIDSAGSVNLSQAGSSPVARFSLLQYSNDNQTSQLQFFKSKAASLGGNTIVANGDQIGMLRFYGANGTSYTEGARITAVIDGTPGATNDMPTHLAFFTTADNSGSVSERLRIRADGNVGIGYSGDANHRLSIQGETSTSSDFSLVARNSTGYVMGVRNDGRVGIGTSTPSNQLTLSTDSAAKPTTNTWTITSDQRIKTNVQPYAKGLAEICQVNPITYDYNGKGGIPAGPGGVSILAQELQPIFPECVGSYRAKLNEDDEAETDILNYNGHAITFALINAVKELNAKVEALETQLQAVTEV